MMWIIADLFLAHLVLATYLWYEDKRWVHFIVYQPVITIISLIKVIRAYKEHKQYVAELREAAKTSDLLTEAIEKETIEQRIAYLEAVVASGHGTDAEVNELIELKSGNITGTSD